MGRMRWLLAATLAACGGSQAANPSGDAGADATARADAGPSTDAGPDAADAGPPLAGTVVVDRGTTVGQIVPGFVGLSYEKSSLRGGLFRGDNAALVALFKLLGPSILRVGGNSVDETVWQPADAGAPSGDAGTPTITPADVDNLAAFAKAAGWTVLYGVNMKTSTPAVAADEAAYASADLGAALYGFEIGNEVDLYTSTALSTTWSYAIFKSQWTDFAAAIRGRAGAQAPLTGPASASHYATWTVPFAADEGGSIELLTQHYYRANGMLPTSTIELLLTPDPNLPPELSALDTASAHLADHYRLSECNSFYNGGAAGVSDAYGTALWALDFLFTNAEHGATGVNFHGGGNGPGYTPIADANGAVVGARPIFYGMLLFTMAGAGPIYKTTTSAGTLNFTAYAVGAADGSTRVVVVNKDPSTTVDPTIDVGVSVNGATSTAVAGPALGATTGVTLGGASIDPSGTFGPNPPTTLAFVGTKVLLSVPPASAALVVAQ